MYSGWGIAYMLHCDDIIKLLLGLWLIWLSREDWKHLSLKENQLWFCIVLSLMIWVQNGCIVDHMITSSLIPLLLHLYNTYCYYAIGSADIILIWISGWMFGFYGVCFVLLLATWCAGLFVLFVEKKQQIPFIPFLSLAIQVCLLHNPFVM